MNEVKIAIDKLFADKSASRGTTLNNLEAIIEYAAMYADAIWAEAEPVAA